MISAKKISAKYYDITMATNGKGLGSVSCGSDGVFEWHAFLGSAPILSGALLRSIADFIDSVNAEATKPINEKETTRPIFTD